MNTIIDTLTPTCVRTVDTCVIIVLFANLNGWPMSIHNVPMTTSGGLLEHSRSRPMIGATIADT
jgi:hypothetical protein